MKRIYVDPSKCTGCKSCELACAVAHSRYRRPDVPVMQDLFAAIADPTARSRVRVIPVSEEYYPPLTIPIQCRHCENPPCVASCVTGALSKEADGKVSLSPEKCIGCRMCVMSCPFGAIRVDPILGKAVKCDLCPNEPAPACVSSCPTGALIYAEEGEFVGGKHRHVAEMLSEAFYQRPGIYPVDLEAAEAKGS